MDDKTIMASVLGNVKGMCDLAMHGTIESATPAVHTAFKNALVTSSEGKIELVAPSSAPIFVIVAR